MAVITRPTDITAVREGGKILARIINSLVAQAKPGINLAELEKLFIKLAKEAGATPAFLGYQGYPYAICTSVNDEVVHAAPKAARVLRSGDILSIDGGLQYDGWCTDVARTVVVGRVAKAGANTRATAAVQKLINVTKQALEEGISVAKVGGKIGDIGYAVQQFVERNGFSVVRKLVGHGIGRELHEDPAVPNFGVRGRGAVIKSGMLLAIEPMVNAGEAAVIFADDGWTVRTADGKLSAHFEDTVLVRADGVEILTR